MDDHRQQLEAASTRTKPKFAPKAPPRRPPKAEVKDAIPTAEDGAAQAEKLMAKFNANLRRKVPKAENKAASPQVAFGPGTTSSPSIRKFGVPQSKSSDSRSGMKDYNNDIDDDDDDDGRILASSTSTIKDGAIACPSDSGDPFPVKMNKDYEEPWNYNHTYYPTTLPWRRPYSGDPDLLNEAEFGEPARNLEYDESTVKPASDLGLLEECDSKKMFFFQLPTKMPLVKRSASVKGKETARGPKSSEIQDEVRASSLGAFSEGYAGKMLVYKSGAVKLKLGDILYDVNPGSDCISAQGIMAINTKAKHCCSIGEVEKRAIVSSDVDFLLGSVIDLG